MPLVRILSTLIGVAVAAALMLSARPADAQARVRVVDVGAGLCVIATTPAGKTMVYDAGPGGRRCADAVRDAVRGRPIDLLVLSHSDADHIGGAAAILAENEVLQIVHPGDARTGTTINKVRSAIRAETTATTYNLAQTLVPFGEPFDVGAAEATFVAGWHDGHDSEGPDEPKLSGGPLHNGLSIVFRFVYGAHSVLLTGDTVGRKNKEKPADDADACRYAEARMVENAGVVTLASDVLVGQHHGADNASANCFIAEVAPTFVVFSAGSNGTYKHPRAAAAQRFISAGIPASNIFRTDRGDKEGGEEWTRGSIAGCNDPAGDDDVVILLPRDADEPVQVDYINQSTACDASH